MANPRNHRIQFGPGRREKVARVQFGTFEFEKRGISNFDPRDPYRFAVRLTWPQFFAALVAFYLMLNAVFAMLYWLVPGSVANIGPHRFLSAFFFSIETLATVGYGEMYPATPYGHLISAIEIICGVGVTAIITGLTFVRFSRPKAKLLFAANPVVAMYDGKPTLMVQVGNGHVATLLDTTATLSVALLERTHIGKLSRRVQELRLERGHLPVFPLTWTLMHVLDERSPLHGYDEKQALAADVRVIATLEARDPTLAATVQGIRTYGPKDIRFGMRYVDAVTMAEDGTVVGDLTKIGVLEPDVGDHSDALRLE
jgi:inward rectifier potassium channel